jgi:DNA-binding CsgD family transcriptional regulator/PAS domain-containing protein
MYEETTHISGTQYKELIAARISDLDKANQTLRAANNRIEKELNEILKENIFLSDIINEVNALIYINRFNEDNTFTTIWANEKIENMTGSTLAEIQALTPKQIEAYYSEGHYSVVKESIEFYKNNPEDIYYGVFKRQTKTGGWKWFIGGGHVLKTRPDGSPHTCLCIMVDVTRAIGKDKYLRELLNENLQLKKKLELRKLTKRERQVLKFIALGRTSREIAEHLAVSSYTVDTHRKNMLHKLGFRNSAELVRFATECGII